MTKIVTNREWARAERAERELAAVQVERNRLLLMAEECDLAHGPLVAELAAARKRIAELGASE